MTRLIDGEGNLFGRVNVIDVMVVLCLGAIVIAGIGLVARGPVGATETTHVTVETTVQPAVADALALAHPAPESGVVEVGDVRVIDVFAVNTTEVARYTNATRVEKVVRVSLVLETATRDGLAYYDGDRLYVGQGVRFDLTTVVLNGTVVGMGGGGHE